MTAQTTDRKWWHDATCREHGPGMFEPAPGRNSLDNGQIVNARRICDGCPVKDACLTDALEREDAYNVTFRAGLTPEQLRAARRRTNTTRTNRGKGGHKLSPCGTPSAYKRHRRLGEPIDDACRDAYNEAERLRKRQTA